MESREEKYTQILAKLYRSVLRIDKIKPIFAFESVVESQKGHSSFFGDTSGLDGSILDIPGADIIAAFPARFYKFCEIGLKFY